MSKYRRSHVVWKKKNQPPTDVISKPVIEEAEEDLKRSYYVSYVGNRAVYNVKIGDYYSSIPPINATQDEVRDMLSSTTLDIRADTYNQELVSIIVSPQYPYDAYSHLGTAYNYEPASKLKRVQADSGANWQQL